METQGLGWLLLEAAIALGLFIFIVWWTMKLQGAGLSGQDSGVLCFAPF